MAAPGGIKVSVVIPTFNAADFIARAIDSVVAQGIRDIEILVVDDKSTDETVAVAERKARSVPALRILRQTQNGGPAKARNAGLAQAKGEYVCFLDADDAYADGTLAAAAAHLDNMPWMAAVDCRVALAGSHRDVHPMLLNAISNSLPSNMMIRTEFVRAIGGFPEYDEFRGPRAGEDLAIRTAIKEWGAIHRMEGGCLLYTVREGSHFDIFLDNARIENGTIAYAPLRDDGILAQACHRHIIEVRDRMCAVAGVGATQILRAGDFSFRTFDNPTSSKHALETLNGKTYPRIPGLDAVATVLDIGANIGASAIYFANLYPNARIVALEPSRKPFALLRINTLGRKAIRPYPIGLYDATVRRQMFTGRPDAVANSVFRNALSGEATEEIQLVAAGHFLERAGIPQPDIIKIDTEGGEVPIMTSMPEVFRRAKAIYLEYHSESDRRWIDSFLADSHILFYGTVATPHRGELVYVRNDAIAAGERDRWRIGGA